MTPYSVPLVKQWEKTMARAVRVFGPSSTVAAKPRLGLREERCWSKAITKRAFAVARTSAKTYSPTAVDLSCDRRATLHAMTPNCGSPPLT